MQSPYDRHHPALDELRQSTGGCATDDVVIRDDVTNKFIKPRPLVAPERHGAKYGKRHATRSRGALIAQCCTNSST
jgi:hypothetical protein